MSFENDRALMAGASYISNRKDKNKFPVPDNWIEIEDSHGNGHCFTYYK